MALWGKRDSFSITGTIAVNNGNTIVTGTSTLFDVEVEPGTWLLIDGNEYRVENITSNTVLNISTTYEGASNTGMTVTGRDIPKHEIPDEARKYYGVDVVEAAVSNTALGLTTPGWVKYTTYTDTNGKVRHKSEVIVAASFTQAEANDAVDDTILPDS